MGNPLSAIERIFTPQGAGTQGVNQALAILDPSSALAGAGVGQGPAPPGATSPVRGALPPPMAPAPGLRTPAAAVGGAAPGIGGPPLEATGTQVPGLRKSLLGG
jgi:hypothetical protein